VRYGWSDGLAGLVGDSAWSKVGSLLGPLAKIDPFSIHWAKGDAAETVKSLAKAAADNPEDARRPVSMRRLMTEGIHSGRLTRVGTLSSSVKWCENFEHSVRPLNMRKVYMRCPWLVWIFI